MSESTITKSKIFMEDIALSVGGTGAAESGTRRTSTGGSISLTKIDISHLSGPRYLTAISLGTLQTAINKFGSNAGLIHIFNNITINTDLTIPTNIAIRVDKGSILTIPTSAAVQTVGTGLSDLTPGGSCSTTTGDIYTFKITTAAGTDKFEWKVNAGAYSAEISMIAGTAITIEKGLTVTWAASTGHTLNDEWTVTPKTLTINGPLEAGLYQIFSCTGTGKVVFGNGAAKSLHPEWWGAKSDNFTNSATAFTACLVSAIDSGIEVKLANGTYKINSTVAATMAAGKSLSISGQGGGTVIDVSGVPYSIGYGTTDVFGIYITGTPSTDPNNVVRLNNFRMIGGATDLGGLTGLRLDSVGQTIFSGVIATGMPSIGIWTVDVGFVTAIGCNFSSNYYAGAIFSGDLTKARGVRVFGGEYNSNGCGAGPNYGGDIAKGIGYGIVLDVQQIYAAGIRSHSNDRYGVDFRGGSDVTIEAPYIFNSGLCGIHGQNYQVAVGGGINIKIVGGTVDNGDRAGSTHGIIVGPWDSPSATSWGRVNEIIISGMTVKRCLASAIFTDIHKMGDGTASVRKLIIKDNVIEHTDPTNEAAMRQILVGNYTSIGAGGQYVDSSIIQNNILLNGGILHGNGKNSDISHNKQTWTGTPYSNELIRCYADNSIQNHNTFVTVADLTINPLLRVAGGGNYSGLANIREMMGNTNNGKHLPVLWDWIYNNSELSFKYSGNTVGAADRVCLEMIFSGAVKKTALIQAIYSRIGGTGASPTNVIGEFNEGAIVDDAGAVTFAGASPYSITPVKQAALGAGSPGITWKLSSGINTIDLNMNPNADSLIEAEIKVRYSGTIASMIVRVPSVSDYIQ